MRAITRRAAMFATWAIGVITTSSTTAASSEAKMVEAWQAQIRVPGYWVRALVFERPEGMLVVERMSNTYNIASPGKRLGGCSYFAPPDMEVTLVSKVEVPISLLDAALAIPAAHVSLLNHSDFLLPQLPLTHFPHSL